MAVLLNAGFSPLKAVFSDAANISPINSSVFRNRIMELRDLHERYAENLSLKNDYSRFQCWLSPDAEQGFAVGADGELTNVFCGSGARGKGPDLIRFATETYSGLHLNCFAGKIEKFYIRQGFLETHREKNWNGPDFPDVVFMRYPR